ncbi:MAG: FGGY family carbohydrate kinase [Nitrospirota bacterium]|nr:FGGY family carbohydrate kinase [Nitrospirota bacterium]
MALSLALDLGSTTLKCARLDREGHLHALGSTPAPPVFGQGLIREADADGYAEAALDLLRRAAAECPGMPLGIASQRSSFLLWERQTGDAVTPVISWQDRSPEAWCHTHTGLEPELERRTGLVLSPHYAGPKLAAILEQNPAFRDGLAKGTLCFGTLETWLIWKLTGGRVHRTDPSMAGRTAMMDLDSGIWSPELLSAFGIPEGGLPAIGSTRCGAIPLYNGLHLGASISDQAAGALAVLPPDGSEALVNLGTGGFVLRLTHDRSASPARFLTGPALDGQPPTFTVEGTINAIAPLLEELGRGPTLMPATDPAPGGFCLPDSAGVGAPHWRADMGPEFSPQARRLMPADLRRVALEGVVFRVVEILHGLAALGPLRCVRLAGGLAREPFVPKALAAASGLPVVLLDEPEATLLGAARLAAGLLPFAAPAGQTVDPDGAWLADKYRRWKAWSGALLA